MKFLTKLWISTPYQHQAIRQYLIDFSKLPIYDVLSPFRIAFLRAWPSISNCSCWFCSESITVRWGLLIASLTRSSSGLSPMDFMEAFTWFYDFTKKTHSVTYTRTSASYDVSVTNPTLFGTGSSALMTGNIKAYHVYQAQVAVTKYRTVNYQEWLFWWMP